jgi:cyclic beta-1,2-glucan synthetase
MARWKILDNLRRSLVAPTTLLLLVVGWLLLPGAAAMWTLAAVGVTASQLLPLVASLIVGPHRAQSVPVFLANLRRDVTTTLAHVALSLTFLAFHAFDSAHAIAVTLVRLVTRRRLLEWETAASTAGRLVGQRGLSRFAADMIASPIAAVVSAVAVAAWRPGSLAVASPFLLAWMAAPLIAYWLSVPVGARVRPLGESERAVMRRAARKTWRFFETFVTAAEGWLPPDNFQQSADVTRIARRTSPTNIGMGLLSTLAAYDLGYLSASQMLERIDRTVRTLESLERFNGHFLNWYDTATRVPLHPRYVSTVDSGNLAGALMALAQGLRQLDESPQTRAQRLDGLADTVSLLAEASSTAEADSSRREEITLINGVARRLLAAVRKAALAEGRGADSGVAVAALRAAAADLSRVSTPGPGDGASQPGELAYWTGAVLDLVARLDDAPAVDGAAVSALAGRLSALADAMRFDFLYDRRRRIFAIGYRMADAEGPGRLDASFYDLLASEARLASFVAIAKGDVPQHHWFHLGRLVTNVNGRATLMSWGGTMFEYLMPQLLMRNFPGTLLDQSCRASVRRQIEYGRRRGVPI